MKKELGRKIYTDKYGGYHDKPCIDGLPSSNNMWIYTSMAKNIGLRIDKKNLRNVFSMCYNSTEEFPLTRLPNKEHPPISRDELIGMVSLGILGYWFFEELEFYFVQPIKEYKKISLLRQFKALWFLKDKHRNYGWEQEVKDAYPLMFRLWWHDRFYIKYMSKIKVSLVEKLAFYLYKKSIMKSGTSGEQNLLWTQLIDLEDFDGANKIDVKTNMLDYFGEDHVFNNN